MSLVRPLKRLYRGGLLLAGALTGGWLLSAALSTPVKAAEGEALYRWRQVPIGGGGYVTGIVIHPRQPDLVYIRTDVGGAYRWEADQERWLPIADEIGAGNTYLSGVESLALDANDPDVVYIVLGMYRTALLATQGLWKDGDELPYAAFKSTDRGATWQKLPFVPASGANEDWRWVGERLQVDPNDGRIVLFGSRMEGLWRSADGGASWTTVESLPQSDDLVKGVMWVLFDPASGKPGAPTPVIYAGVADHGIMRSADAGATWQSLAEGENAPSPAQVMQRAALASDGTLYATLLPGGGKAGGLFKYHDGLWTDISPRRGLDYNAVSVDPRDPARLVVVHQAHGFGNAIFLSEDGGALWRQMQYEATFSVPWYLKEMWASSVSAIAFDPHHAGRVWFTDWYNIWRTDDVWATPSQWRNLSAGHEETVTLNVVCPPSGAPLFSGVADVSGFRHESLTDYPPNVSARFMVQDITGLDYAERDPNFMVFTGGRRYNNQGDGAFSTDNGRTWTKFAKLPPGAQHGRIAVSADGRSIVWIPTALVPFYSTDRGASWRASTGVPPHTMGVLWNPDSP